MQLRRPEQRKLNQPEKIAEIRFNNSREVHGGHSKIVMGNWTVENLRRFLRASSYTTEKSKQFDCFDVVTFLEARMEQFQKFLEKEMRRIWGESAKEFGLSGTDVMRCYGIDVLNERDLIRNNVERTISPAAKKEEKPLNGKTLDNNRKLVIKKSPKGDRWKVFEKN